MYKSPKEFRQSFKMNQYIEQKIEINGKKITLVDIRQPREFKYWINENFMKNNCSDMSYAILKDDA